MNQRRCSLVPKHRNCKSEYGIKKRFLVECDKHCFSFARQAFVSYRAGEKLDKAAFDSF
jgi:hypothetical protein